MPKSRTPFVHRRVLRWLIGIPASILAVAIIVAACLVTWIYAQGKADATGNSEYVALGSSFAAGPGITSPADGSPALCGRSEDNYAHVLARREGLNLTDMTCSGATTSHILDGGQYFQGPQLMAIEPSTKIVTITIGGNDVSYLGNLFAWSCQQGQRAVPLVYRVAGVCDVHSESEVAAAFETLPDQLTAIVTEIREVAPDAQIIFVDYTTVLPRHGVCEALPITEEQADRARAVAVRLEDITAAIAHDTQTNLVRASAITKDHDVCSSDAWVSGFEWGNNPMSHGVIAYHPREAAMKRIATAIGKVVE